MNIRSMHAKRTKICLKSNLTLLHRLGHDHKILIFRYIIMTMIKEQTRDIAKSLSNMIHFIRDGLKFKNSNVNSIFMEVNESFLDIKHNLIIAAARYRPSNIHLPSFNTETL